jgi:hypothetical protein
MLALDLGRDAADDADADRGVARQLVGDFARKLTALVRLQRLGGFHDDGVSSESLSETMGRPPNLSGGLNGRRDSNNENSNDGEDYDSLRRQALLGLSSR